LGKFWRAFEWKILISLTAIWYSLWQFTFYFYANLVHMYTLYDVVICCFIPILVYHILKYLATLDHGTVVFFLSQGILL
jgi:hypothetical protein